MGQDIMPKDAKIGRPDVGVAPSPAPSTNPKIIPGATLPPAPPSVGGPVIPNLGITPSPSPAPAPVDRIGNYDLEKETVPVSAKDNPFSDMPKPPEIQTSDMRIYTDAFGNQKQGSSTMARYHSQLKKYFDANPGAEEYYKSQMSPSKPLPSLGGRIDTTIQPGSGFQDNQPQPPLRRGQDITLPGDKIGIGDEPVPAPSPTPPPRPTPSPEPEPTPPSTGGVQIGDRKDIAGEEHIWNGNAWIATGRQGGVYEDDGGAGGQVGIGDQDDEDVGGQEEDEDEEDTTPPPTPAPTPTPRGRELAEDILSGDFQAPQIPAVEEVPIGEDIPVYKIEEDFGIPMSEVATLPQRRLWYSDVRGCYFTTAKSRTSTRNAKHSRGWRPYRSSS
jgi:hypothetical protein